MQHLDTASIIGLPLHQRWHFPGVTVCDCELIVAFTN
jgi:hypothetical protein